MAKLISTAAAAAALFLLFAFSHARTPSDLPNGLDDAKIDENQIPVTDANPTKPTTKILFLPSERPGSEAQTVGELEPEVFAEEQKLPDAAEFATIEVKEEDTAEASKSETVPLTVISFRPVGRHFPRRPFPLTSRHGRPCRHGHWSSRFHGGEREDTHYGNDMILSSGDELKFEHPSHGVVRQIPARWFNFRHGGPRFPFNHDDEMESERPRHHHHHHHHHRHHEHEQEFEAQKDGEEIHREHKHDHEHRHEHGHGLFRNVRKFLNRF